MVAVTDNSKAVILLLFHFLFDLNRYVPVLSTFFSVMFGWIILAWTSTSQRISVLSTPIKYFTDRSKAVLLLWIFFYCLVFAMPLYTSVYMCLVVTCWERADLLALVCGVLLWVCYYPIGILGQVWYLIVSIPDLCTLWTQCSASDEAPTHNH